MSWGVRNFYNLNSLCKKLKKPNLVSYFYKVHSVSEFFACPDRYQFADLESLGPLDYLEAGLCEGCAVLSIL